MGPGGGSTPSRPARGAWGSAVSFPIGVWGGAPEALQLCVINVLNHKEFHQFAGLPPENHGNEFEIAIVHLKCLLGCGSLLNERRFHKDTCNYIYAPNKVLLDHFFSSDASKKPKPMIISLNEFLGNIIHR